MASILFKVKKIFFDRPTVFLSYLRQTYLFYQTRILFKIFIPLNSKTFIGKNVRFQSLKNLLIEKQAAFSIGDNCIVYENAKLEVLGESSLSIGKNSIIGDARITCREKITIGPHFLTSWNVFISDYDAHPVDPILRQAQMDNMTTHFFPSFDQSDPKVAFDWKFTSSSISIGSNVWIGANVSILKGAHIGDNCIVATGSVVTKGEYPSHSILAGNPAKVVKTLSH